MRKKVNLSISERQADEEEIADEICAFQIGCGNCLSRRIPLPGLECGNNAKCFLVLLSITVFIQTLVAFGLTNSIIVTIEKRFHLQSSETGFIAGCYDLGFFIAIPLVSYVGGRNHKPRWIGWGTFTVGLGSVILTLPHFIAPTYTIPDSTSYVCAENTTHDGCVESNLRVYRVFFIVGRILHGIGLCSIMILTITYIDANMKKSRSSLYHGIFYASSMAGSGVGFIAGGALNRLYINLGERVTIDETSNHWIGNWWLGFLIGGIILLLLATPITFFPKQLPNTSEYRQNREDEIHQNPEALQAKGDENLGKRFRDIPQCLKAVLKNVTLLCVSVSEAMDSGAIIAMGVFGPKFVEGIYRIPPSSSSIYLGVSVIAAAFASHLLGGYIVSRCNLGIKTMIKFCIGCAILALGCTFGFLIRCENPDIPGVNMPYNGESTYQCEGLCGCGTELYDPVCGADGLSYLSFCDAGCTLTDSGKMINCTRIASPNDILTLQNAVATSGKCNFSTPCLPVGIQIAIAGFMAFFSLLKYQPALQVSLRTVPFHQRSVAIGIRWMIMKCLGLIPLPLILGGLLDRSCMVWEELCGDCGSCRVYDNNSLSNSFTILLACTKIISIVSLVIALYTYKAPTRGDSSQNELNPDQEFCETSNVKLLKNIKEQP